MSLLLDPRNGEAFDLPVPPAKTRTYVIASVPRSGSTLLCRMLWDTGGAGAPKEYLNPMQLRDWEVRLGKTWARRVGHALAGGRAAGLVRGRGWSEARLLEHLERVRSRRTDPTGWFGLKIHRHHFEGWFTSRGWDAESILRPDRWIRIRREDRVAQAVSWARALQTGRWASHQRASLPALYRPRQIERLALEIDRQEACWDEYFAGAGRTPLCLTYEQLVGDFEGTIRRVLAHLEVSGAAEARVAEPALRSQTDSVNADWIERYRAAQAPGVTSRLE